MEEQVDGIEVLCYAVCLQICYCRDQHSNVIADPFTFLLTTSLCIPILSLKMLCRLSKALLSKRSISARHETLFVGSRLKIPCLSVKLGVVIATTKSATALRWCAQTSKIISENINF